MPSLFSALQSTASTIQVFERALTVSQNNVANASTAGYAKQIQGFEAMPFDSASGLSGGVRATPTQTARDTYAEAAVQQAVSSLGTWEQQVNTLSPVQIGFDLTGTSGIPGALSGLYQSFSAWSVAPSDATARQNVLNAAQNLSQAFQQTSTTLTHALTSADSQLGGLVDQINTLAGQVQEYNVQRSANASQNSALEANLYSSLEQLSEVANISTLKQPDGSITLLLGGQTPLVVGATQYKISLNVSVPTTPPPTYPGAPPTASILDASGQDITSQISQGQVAGLLSARNGVLASLVGDSTQPGDLNRLAQAIADRVNGLLTSGNISNGPPAVAGVPLFTYDATNPSTIAQTLSVDPAVTPDQLAAISTGANASANGVPLALANLESPQNPADEIDTLSYTSFFGNLAARVGSAVSVAQSNQSVQQDVVTQTRNLRQQTSGVSLDEEAINVLEFQRSYQAAAKLVNVLDELTQTAINMLQ